MITFRLRNRIFIPLISFVLLFWIILMLSTYLLLKKGVEADFEREMEYIQGRLQYEINENSHVMQAMTAIALRNSEITHAMQQEKEEALLAEGERLLQSLDPAFGITLLYFIDAQNRVLLRVHDPDHNGDVLESHIVEQARQTGRQASGMEIGVHGRLVQRVVQPVYAGQQLLGFIELGTPIRQLLNNRRLGGNPELYLTLHKRHLVREQWLHGIEDIGMNNNWDAFPGVVVVIPAGEHTPTYISTLLEQEDDIVHGQMFADNTQGRKLRIGALGLSDASGNKLGDILFVTDVSERYALFNKEITLILLLGIVLAAPGLPLIFWLLGKADRVVRSSQRQLIEERNALVQSDKQLKNNIRQATEAKAAALNMMEDAHLARQTAEKAETELREIQARHVEAQRLAHLGHWDLDFKDNRLTWSKETFRIFGLTPDQFDNTYEAFLACIHPDDRERVKRTYDEAVNNKTALNIEHRLLLPDGSVKWVNERCITDYSADDGSPLRSTGTVQDITERKQSEDELRKLSQAVENAGEAVMITDHDSVIEYVNPAFTEITGFMAEDALGKKPSMLKSSAQDPSFYKEMWETITRGEVWHGTLIDKRKDGSFYPALMSVAPISGDDGQITHYVAIQQDMSEYRKLEEQFLQSQKMEAVGVLVGGIAHDFNNMLAGIMGNTYLAKSRAKDDEKLLRKLETIDKLSLRAADMIKQMLTFARKDRLEMRIFSLTGFVKEAMKLAAAAIPENIEHSCNYPSEELFVHGDATQLQQVLMNLINNARDSLEGVRDGKIACSLKPFTADAAFRKRHPACLGDSFACLTVQDNGEGIPEELLSRIFDPFFTTKEVDKGTGLGLAMVYGSIESHKGAIEVDSAAGRGTTFNIYLPLVRQAAEEKQVPLQDVKTGNKELILIADDEETVRQMYEEVLGALDYRVITACDGGEAVSLFEQKRDAIALVILDVVMPVMGGVDAARRILQLDAQVPIVFATGYDKQTALKGEDGITDYTILNKPFSVESLSSTIRALLD